MFNVMIVDDEPLTCTFLSTMIPKLDSRWEVVATASDGKQALDLLASHCVDLVITDIKMPIMDGVKLCHHVYQNYPHIHLIILSGYGEFDYARQALNYNVFTYLLKPINNNELVNSLHQIAKKINKTTENNQSLKQLIGLSNLFKHEIAIKFLQAVIHNSYVKTQALLPLIYEHKMELLKEEGLIMIIAPAPHIINHTNYIKNQDLTNLLIYQLAKDSLKAQDCYVLLDEENRTLIYTTYTQDTSVSKLCEYLLRPIAKEFKLSTNYELVAYIGDSVSELLAIDHAYSTGVTCMFNAVSTNTNQNTPLYFYPSQKLCIDTNRLNTEVSNYIYAVKSSDLISIKHARSSFDSYPDSISLYLFYLLKNSLENRDDFLPTSLNIICLFNTYEALHLTNAGTSSDDSIIESAKEYIHKNYSAPISLSIIAEHLSISPSYLSNLFHDTVGVSYIKYLTELRLNEALILLRHKKNMTIEQITLAVGYLSVKHFSYVFKKEYGMTPGQYRKSSQDATI